MRKILHVITGLHRGGAESMLYRLLGSIDRQRFRPSVISLVGGGEYATKIKELDIPVFSLDMLRGFPNPVGLWQLRLLIQQLKPDLIHAWMYHAGLATLLVNANKPCIVGIRSGLENFAEEKWLTRQVIKTLARLSNRADSIVYCSRNSQLQHEEFGYSRIKGEFIPNGFDCNLFKPLDAARQAIRQSLSIKQSAFVVGTVGRFHPVKDYDNLLKAFSHFYSQRPDAVLLMAGNGLSQPNLELMGQIEKLGIGEKVILLGARDDIPQVMNALDVFVNASYSEAFPNVVGEAMSCGVPCIATDVGDSALIVGDAGMVIPPQDSVALSSALRDFSILPYSHRQQLSTRARQCIIDRFSLDRIVHQYEDLYARFVH